MRLKEMLKDVENYHLYGNSDIDLTGISYDSRQVRPGDLFVAIKGNKKDGHRYIHDALVRGATAIVGEEIGDLQIDRLKVEVEHSRKALAEISAAFYGYPNRELRLIGVTGTSGKTTTAYIIESILQAADVKTGVIGTINYRFQGKHYPAPVTTPESLDLMRLLREMSDNGVSSVIMEVSSHAIDQGRVGDCNFKVAVFTNLSRDHLDYHVDMEAYFQTKSLLFESLGKGDPVEGPFAVINIDDPRGEVLIGLTQATSITYGLKQEADVRAEDIQINRDGIGVRLILPTGEQQLTSSLIGEINLYNILAATAVAHALRIDPAFIVQGIESVKGIPGRLESVKNSRGLSLIVDYAHKPDALLKTLMTLKPLTPGRLITVFGCGGDRDTGKRPEMGLIAGNHSDLVFVTSDNPRSENPVKIVDQIEEGLYQSGLPKRKWPAKPEDLGQGYFIEIDRRKAIEKAVRLATEEDLILIAGKGHEDYQIIGEERRQFDDRLEAARAADETKNQ
jgi:UDP-N-acetylmuramoyl-L-alanyl-D-glutamate--2,6-diaminopimelate ligase